MCYNEPIVETGSGDMVQRFEYDVSGMPGRMYVGDGPIQPSQLDNRLICGLGLWHCRLGGLGIICRRPKD